MSAQQPQVGTISWTDLTVDDAAGIRDFYRQVVGWEPSDVDMGEYADFAMIAPATGEAMAGICHKLGSNAELPSQWLIYITVADVDASAAACVELGGKVLVGPKEMGGFGRYCVVQDPAGACAALFQPAGE